MTLESSFLFMFFAKWTKFVSFGRAYAKLIASAVCMLTVLMNDP